MSQAKKNALEEGLKKLMQAARPEMLRRLSVVEEAAKTLRSGDLRKDIRKPAHAEAHKLAGVLGTYGLLDASRAAHGLEVMLEKPQSKDVERMFVLIGEVRSAVEGK